MKAILEFNLPEEREDFALATNAWKFKSALLELASIYRSNAKHSDEEPTWGQVKDLFWSVLQDEGIELE